MTYDEIVLKYQEKEGKEFSQRELASALGWSAATVNQVASGKYPNAGQKLAEMAEKLLGVKEQKAIWSPIVIRPDVIIPTNDLARIFSLANGLLDVNSSITSSIGLITGEAGRGKTTAVKKFACESLNTAYILYMGYTKGQLFKEIAETLVGRSTGSYYNNLKLITAATQVCRKLIIIDEADRMPLSLLEDVRTLNESGLVPILLVGEPSLAKLTKRADRIDSRIRKPRIEMESLNATTLSTLYKESTGLILEPDVIKELLVLCDRDFRRAVNDMQNLVGKLNIIQHRELTKEVIRAYKQQ